MTVKYPSKEVPLINVKPYAKNTKRHDAKQINDLKMSIEENDFLQPLVIDENGVLIVGHGRYQALMELGRSHAECKVVNDWSEAKKKRYRILDNKTNESEWVKDFLKDEVGWLKENEGEYGLLGFEPEDLDKMLENKPKKERQLEFATELLEEHNYVVLYFDNTMDWQVAKEKLNLHTVKSITSTDTLDKNGIGRVIRGADIIKRL